MIKWRAVGNCFFCLQLKTPWVTSGKFIDVFLIIYWYILVKVPKQCQTGKAFIRPAVHCMQRGGAGSRPLTQRKDNSELPLIILYIVHLLVKSLS